MVGPATDLLEVEDLVPGLRALNAIFQRCSDTYFVAFSDNRVVRPGETSLFDGTDSNLRFGW